MKVPRLSNPDGERAVCHRLPTAFGTCLNLAFLSAANSKKYFEHEEEEN